MWWLQPQVMHSLLAACSAVVCLLGVDPYLYRGFDKLHWSDGVTSSRRHFSCHVLLCKVPYVAVPLGAINAYWISNMWLTMVG
jgi:hypothetical protein